MPVVVARVGVVQSALVASSTPHVNSRVALAPPSPTGQAPARTIPITPLEIPTQLESKI